MKSRWIINLLLLVAIGILPVVQIRAVKENLPSGFFSPRTGIV